MVDSNLAVLLAERNLKITKVSRETGISRTTLTALCYDHSGGIKFDTLNTLCKYLGITPAEFFSYSQYDYEIEFLGETDYEDTFLKQVGMSEYEYTMNVIVKRENMTWKYPVRGICGDFQGDSVPYEQARIGISPYYYDHYEDYVIPSEATQADMPTIREFERMLGQMTVRQRNDMNNIMINLVRDAFIKDYAADHNLDISEVPAGEDRLLAASSI